MELIRGLSEKAMEAAMAFEKAMAELRNLLAPLSDEAFDQLRADILDKSSQAKSFSLLELSFQFWALVPVSF